MSTPRPVAASRGRPEEAGYSIVELMAVVLIFAVFGLALQTSIVTFTRVTRSTQDKTSIIGDLRTAEEAITRDLRAANPIDDIYPEPVTAYDNKIRFSVYCSTPGTGDCGSDKLRKVTYRVVSHRLERVTASTTKVLIGPEDQPAVPVAERLGAVATTEPVFTYKDKNGVVLDTTGGSVTTRRVRDCTKSVQIHLKVVSEPRKTDTKYNLVTTVDLRNFNEVVGC